ncbi:MAG: dephospho-CoA kinase [Bdellovibrionales bacterium]
MKWVGLTGGLGTGKSTVSRLLLRHGIPVIDADAIARQVLELHGPAYGPVVQNFGPEILQSNNVIDRKRLAEKVFGRPAELEKLERIVHPFVQAEVKRQRQWLEDQHAPGAVYDVPLLFEKGLEKQFDAIIVVTAQEPQQIERVKARNSWTDEEIQKRLRSQIALNDKVAQADFLVQNDADLPTLEKKVATLVEMLNDFFHKEES